MIRVVGLGSPFGADRAGWWVVDGLRGRVPAQIDLVALDRPGAALINWMAGVDHLVVIDAVVDGGPPGRILRISPQQLDDGQGVLTSHQLALTATLQLARTLKTLPSRVEIYGVSITDLNLDGELVKLATARLADDLSSQLTQIASPAGNESRSIRRVDDR